MFIFDLLRNEQERVRAVALSMGAGLIALLGGLWFVQVVSARHFEEDLEKQSYRTVRVSSIRGRILDRNGEALAENRPHYNAVVYLEELRNQFEGEFAVLKREYIRRHPEVVTKKRISIAPTVRAQLQSEADYLIVSNMTWKVGAMLKTPRSLEQKPFLQHYGSYPYVPFQIIPNLAPRQVAIFAEQLSSQPALELETQSVRFYPHGTTAAHLLGFVKSRETFEDDDMACQYRLPDYEGKSGVESAFDEQMRGLPGVKSVLVNNRGYRQREQTITPTEGGDDICLTIDASVQQAAEKGLALVMDSALKPHGGAAVVMDVRNGDILAMASAPTFDPNEYITGFSDAEWERLNDAEHAPQFNRALTGAYPPGSTFKIIDAIACLETGVLDPNEEFDSPGEFSKPGYHKIGDPAGPGKFNFARAMYRSSNTYFIHYGMKAGMAKLLEVAKRFHLGEKTHLDIHPETAGNVPNPQDIGHKIQLSSEPDVCIGQEITVSPIQMAAMTAAIANGGTLYWPRVVRAAISPDTEEQREINPPGRVRDRIALNPHHLDLIREAMLLDTEHGTPGDLGTAYLAFHTGGAPALGGFRVAGKTGTAQVERSDKTKFHDTWFVSFGPYESPRYAVVVVVDHGNYGGDSCAPVACAIYKALIKSERLPSEHGGRLAEAAGH
jgi:penicillin-binding protein 2